MAAPRCRVLLLETADIFANLALEDAIFQSVALREQEHLLVWRSAPCVVIGRHQNPWAEAKVAAAERANVPIVRRMSGGGTVCHDRGNLNISFMTSRERYDRNANLSFLAGLLQRRWKRAVSLSPRDDLLLDGKFKISGTAAKLARLNAYHHCTLLFNADLDRIRQFLGSSFPEIESKATASVPSPVANLGITCAESLVESLIEEFITWKAPSEFDVCRWNPDFDLPDGVSKEVFEATRRQLTSWDWTFGRTPKFTVIAGGVRLEVERGRFSELQCRSAGPGQLHGLGQLLLGLPARASVLASALERFLTSRELSGAAEMTLEEHEAISDLENLSWRFGS